MQRDLQVELAPDLPHLLVALDIDLAAHDHAQKLVVGGEILLPDAARAAGMLLAVPPAFEIAEDAAAARVAQSLDGGVGMLGGMVDLAHVHHGRHARIQLRKPAVELVDIDILRAVVLREAQKHLLVVVPLVLGPSVIDDDGVRQGGAQARFELVVVRVDEARHHDLARGVDHMGVGGLDAGGRPP
jgi:hypothetical protein